MVILFQDVVALFYYLYEKPKAAHIRGRRFRPSSARRLSAVHAPPAVHASPEPVHPDGNSGNRDDGASRASR
jgi:hypothetical protein